MRETEVCIEKKALPERNRVVNKSQRWCLSHQLFYTRFYRAAIKRCVKLYIVIYILFTKGSTIVAILDSALSLLIKFFQSNIGTTVLNA